MNWEISSSVFAPSSGRSGLVGSGPKNASFPAMRRYSRGSSAITPAGIRGVPFPLAAALELKPTKAGSEATSAISREIGSSVGRVGALSSTNASIVDRHIQFSTPIRAACR